MSMMSFAIPIPTKTQKTAPRKKILAFSGIVRQGTYPLISIVVSSLDSGQNLRPISEYISFHGGPSISFLLHGRSEPFLTYTA